MHRRWRTLSNPLKPATTPERHWHSAAAVGGADPQYRVGVLRNERGAIEEAQARWRAAAEADRPSTQYNLGVVFYSRDYVPSRREAETRWRRAERAGDR